MLFDLLLLFKILSVFQELASQLQSLESNETEFCELVFCETEHNDFFSTQAAELDHS